MWHQENRNIGWTFSGVGWDCACAHRHCTHFWRDAVKVIAQGELVQKETWGKEMLLACCFV